jgi:membrane protease YdiL (CAAX protease family)
VTLFGQAAPTEIEAAEVAGFDMPMLALLVAALATWGWAAWRMRQHCAPVPYQGHRTVPWNGWDVATVFVSLCAILLLGEMITLLAFGAGLPQSGEIPDEMMGKLVVAQSVAELVAMLGAIWLLARRSGADWSDLGLDWRQVRGDLVIGLVGFLAIGGPVHLLYGMIQTKEPQLHPLIKLAMRQPSLLWLIGVSVVFVAPLVEEFFFRVVLQGWLERRERMATHERNVVPLLAAGAAPILTSSVLFAMAHIGQWPAPVPLFVLALVLGYLYHQTHRLLPSLVVHVLFNGTTFLSLCWLIQNGSLPGQ